MSNLLPFTPTPTSTISVSATDSASAAAALSTQGHTLLLTNFGDEACYVRIGGDSVAAALTDLPILSKTAQTIRRDPTTQTHISAICDTGLTATLKATTGEGE